MNRESQKGRFVTGQIPGDALFRISPRLARPGVFRGHVGVPSYGRMLSQAGRAIIPYLALLF